VVRARAACCLLLFAFSLHLVVVLAAQQRGQSLPVTAGTERYSLLVMNVQSENPEPEALSTLIQEVDADTVIITELTPPLSRHLHHSTDYPHYFGKTLTTSHGIGVFSRYAFSDTSLPDFGVRHAPAVQVSQTVAGIGLTLVGVHPIAPTAPARYHNRNLQFRNFATFAQHHSGPLIMAGDFNSTHWSRHFTQLLDDSGLVDGNRGWGIAGTWPGCKPLLSIPIDHVLISDHVQIAEQRTVTIPGSDHCGLLVHWQFSQQTKLPGNNVRVHNSQ